MEEVALAMNARYRQGGYANLFQSIDGTLDCLIARPRKSVSFRREATMDEYGGESTAQQGALDILGLLKHWHQQGREQTYLVRDCSVLLSTGDTAVRAYVMPKYQLRFVTERSEDGRLAFLTLIVPQQTRTLKGLPKS